MAVNQSLQAVSFMHFAGGYLGCGDDLMFVINTSVNLIFKLGSDFVPGDIVNSCV